MKGQSEQSYRQRQSGEENITCSRVAMKRLRSGGTAAGLSVIPQSVTTLVAAATPHATTPPPAAQTRAKRDEHVAYLHAVATAVATPPSRARHAHA